MLSNDEVLATVASAASPESAVAKIRDNALSEWEQKMMSDNVTVILVEVLGAATRQGT